MAGAQWTAWYRFQPKTLQPERVYIEKNTHLRSCRVIYYSDIKFGMNRAHPGRKLTQEAMEIEGEIGASRNSNILLWTC